MTWTLALWIIGLSIAAMLALVVAGLIGIALTAAAMEDVDRDLGRD